MTLIHPTARRLLREKDGLSASLPEVLGAVGISILVLSLAAFGIGAGVNFSQDSGTEGSLQSLAAAQIMHQSKTGKFGTMMQLTEGSDPAMTGAPENVRMFVTEDNRNYCALAESGSMNHTRYLTTAQGRVIELKGKPELDAAVNCAMNPKDVSLKSGDNSMATTNALITPIPKGATTMCLSYDLEPGPAFGSRDLSKKPLNLVGRIVDEPGNIYGWWIKQVTTLDGGYECTPLDPKATLVRFGFTDAPPTSSEPVAIFSDLAMVFE